MDATSGKHRLEEIRQVAIFANVEKRQLVVHIY
jgi:hypothetical protein